MTSRIVIVLALALMSLHGDDDAQWEPRLMDLNVVAVDSHQQPVNDLTSGDFQITDAGKRQKIVLFRHSDSKLWQSPPSALNEFSNRSGANVPHATLILFDLLNVLGPGVPPGANSFATSSPWKEPTTSTCIC